MDILGLRQDIPQDPIGQSFPRDRNPVKSFRDRLQQELDDLGWFSVVLGQGRGLAKTIAAVETILDEDFAPVRSRMERWLRELEASAAAAREESIVIYRERGGRRAVKAHHTRDLRLAQTPA